MEGDQSWVAVSWHKAKPIIYEFLEHILLPDYELTIMELVWRGSEKHSFIMMEVWRNFRTERLHFQEILQPILICCFPPPNMAAAARRVIFNLRTKTYDDLARAVDWKPKVWENEKKRWAMLSSLKKEDTYFGGY